MEVHHHSHHPKTWREYLQEFLMLFFAVFLGFLSEYYLEYRAERHKEHDYLVGMKDDIKADLAEMNQRIKGMEQIKSMGNQLEKLLYQPTWTDAQIDSMYVLSIQITATLIAPNFSTGTIDQLRNAGGFRLIKNQEIVRKISDYEKWKETIAIQQEANKVNWHNVHHAQNQILHVTTIKEPDKLNDITLKKGELDKIIRLTGSPFLSTDKKFFYEYANEIWVLKGYVSYYEIMIKMQVQKGQELLKLLEEELNH